MFLTSFYYIAKKSINMKNFILFLLLPLFISSCDRDDTPYGYTDDAVNSEDYNSPNGDSSANHGTLQVSPSYINLDAGGGSRSITVTSNTNWRVVVNNSGEGINGLSLSTTSGYGNGTVVVSYDAVTSQYYSQNASISFFYTAAGNVTSEQTVSLFRRNLP